MTNIAEAPAPTTIVFGTDGWRAKIADDYTFENVRRCADGVARYVIERGEQAKGVVIAYDRRFASEHFAAAAAEVLLAHDIPVAFGSGAMPTQMSSYEVVERSAAAGIVITARIDKDKPQDRRVESLFTEGRFKAAHASLLDEEQIFSHQRHVTSGQECNACHAGIESDSHIDADIGVTMERCMDCHAQLGVANACETCHSVIRGDWEPQSHQHNWKLMHGRIARAGSKAGADNCALCHQESACLSCHQIEAPQSHNNFFRSRGHGMAAMIDRQNCAACHEPSSCDSCHANVLPMSHRGAWGAPKDTHCLGCHFPLASQSCIVCHKDTPSHALATPLPSFPPHNPAMNCRQCHGISAVLPHVDKGDQCTLCHL